LIVLFLTVVLPSSTMRYEVDYAPYFLVPAVLGWLALTSGRGRRVVACVGTLLIVYGCVFGLAISMTGYYDGLRTGSPDTYWALARITSALPTIATMISGHPVVARSFSADDATIGNRENYDLDEVSFGLSRNKPWEIDIIAPKAGRWSLAPTFLSMLPKDSGQPWIEVRVDGADTHQVVYFGSSPQGIDLTLHRGLNRVQLRVSIGAGYDAFDVLISVHGLRLVAR
jgi:hypothetical protein